MGSPSYTFETSKLQGKTFLVKVKLVLADMSENVYIQLSKYLIFFFQLSLHFELKFDVIVCSIHVGCSAFDWVYSIEGELFSEFPGFSVEI